MADHQPPKSGFSMAQWLGEAISDDVEAWEPMTSPMPHECSVMNFTKDGVLYLVWVTPQQTHIANTTKFDRPKHEDDHSDRD